MSASNRDLLDADDGLGDDVSTLSFTMPSATDKLQDSFSNSRSSTRRSSTDFIKPRTSLRGSMQGKSSEFTMNQLRFSDTQIYGREAEVKQLQDSFAKAHSQEMDRQLVLLVGEAGVGKSALAAQLIPTVVRRAGFFIGGKFDRHDDEPYAVFSEACRDLCDGLLGHKMEETQTTSSLRNSLRSSTNSTSGSRQLGGFTCTNKWQFSFQEVQDKLHQELGDELLQVLTTVFPNLMQILGGNYLTNDLSAGGSGSGPIVNADDDDKEDKADDGSADDTDADTNSGSRQDSIIGYNEAKNRFNYAFRRLMRVICSFGTVVLFLDDLQWADPASLDLLQTLVTDCKSPSEEKEGYGLMIVATYRNDHVDKDHPISKMISKLESVVKEDPAMPMQISSLTLNNLTMPQVNDLLLDLLSADDLQETLSLAECVHDKTQGNCFYVVQFLQSLATNTHASTTGEKCSSGDGTSLLTFHMGTFKWIWDVEEIKLRETATQNVVEMIQQKLEKLPEQILSLLPMVACLGHSFQYSILERVLKHFGQEFNRRPSVLKTDKEEEEEAVEPISPEEYIQTCAKEGLLVHDKKKETVQWCHDKIQEAAMSLADEEAISAHRYKLGSFLLKETSQKDIENNIFMILRFLDRDVSKPSQDNPYYVMLAEMNLTASKKAMQGAAFESAADYVARGIRLLPKDHWQTQYSLSLQLFSSAAEAHHCIGEIEQAKEYCEEVIGQSDRPILDKRRAYTVLLESINAEDNTLLAEEKCLEILALLDCSFPSHGRILYTLGGMMKVEMAKRTLETDLFGLPAMTDESKRWTMRLLDRMTVYAYQNKSDIFPLVCFKALKYTLKYGISDYSPPLLCTLAILLAAGLGDTKASHHIAALTMRLYDSPTIDIGQVTKARTLFVGSAFGLHNCEPLSNVKKVVLDGYEVGLRTGDVESALWSIDVYLEMSFHTGVPLGALVKDCRVYSQQMRELKQEKIHLHTLCLEQLIENMLGHSKDPTELTGSVFDLEKVAPRLMEDMTKAQVDRLRIATAFWSGDFIKAAKLVETTGASKGFFDEAFAGNFVLAPLHFQCSLACFCAYQDTGKAKHKRMALLHFKHIKDMAKKSNPNVMDSYMLLQAEVAALKKKGGLEEAVKLYKEAITLAGRQGILQDQALANERLGDLYMQHHLHIDARYHFDQAVRLFKSWGSTHRGYEYLRKRHPTLIDKPSSVLSLDVDPSSALSTFEVSTLGPLTTTEER